MAWRHALAHRGPEPRGLDRVQDSAIAAFIRLTTGQLVSIPVANLGTFLGAVAFFAGALLLIPEMGDTP